MICTRGSERSHRARPAGEGRATHVVRGRDEPGFVLAHICAATEISRDHESSQAASDVTDARLFLSGATNCRDNAHAASRIATCRHVSHAIALAQTLTRTSRTAQHSHVSPKSRCPPGSAYVPAVAARTIKPIGLRAVGGRAAALHARMRKRAGVPSRVATHRRHAHPCAAPQGISRRAPQTRQHPRAHWAYSRVSMPAAWPDEGTI
jgi:hypothetical protein